MGGSLNNLNPFESLESRSILISLPLLDITQWTEMRNVLDMH